MTAIIWPIIPAGTRKIQHEKLRNCFPCWNVGKLQISEVAAGFGPGDFDGDGSLDIFWRNGATGGNIIWFMNGTNLSSVANTTPVSPASGWEMR